MAERKAVNFPGAQRNLAAFGENIRLAIRRRQYTQILIAERTGLSRNTVRKIEQGDPGVSIGHYLAVLHALGLDGDLTEVAKDDELGRKLQDIALLEKGTRR